MGSQTYISIATEVFRLIDTRSMFITIHEYNNNFGEIATHKLCWHVNYANAVAKSYEIMKQFKPTISFCVGKPFTLIDLEAAYQEWTDSLADTLVLGPGNNPRATSAHVYDIVVDKFGKKIPGIKIHKDQGLIHLTDVYRLGKTVHTNGIYPNTHSARKTIAKRYLRQMTPLKRWGQFVLTPGRFKKLVVSKITLTEEDVINKWQD